MTLSKPLEHPPNISITLDLVNQYGSGAYHVLLSYFLCNFQNLWYYITLNINFVQVLNKYLIKVT